MNKFKDASKWFFEAGDGCQELEKKCYYKGLSLLADGLDELRELLAQRDKK
ncbi:MAG: hypothetical protein KKH94_08940 [Candidatus Omnitrophica bacterium]|nr:hypothetical protein [Nanoarchaeota archaeon]MBU1863772.1 hypothetical protein [Candidatus Omnitrophota bacterium]